MKRGCAAQGDETSRSVAGKGEGVLLTVHLDDGVGDLDLVERHGRPGGGRDGGGEPARQVAR